MTRLLSRRLVPLGFMFLASGIATAVVGPFLGLFLSTAVHANPFQVSAFLIVASLSGVGMSQFIARVSDRRPMRRMLLITAALAGFAGTGLTSMVRDYWVLLAITMTVTALAGSFYPQSFAYARQVLAREDPRRAAMGISSLRTVFSIAWVGGPPLAAVLLDVGSFRWVYGTAAVMYLVAALIATRWLPEAEAPAPAGQSSRDDTRPPRVMYPIIAGFVLLTTTMVLGVQAMSLYVTDDLHGSVGDTGLILGLCAALEIPLMLGFGALSTRVPLRRLILGGGVAAVAYQTVAATAHSTGMLATAQVLNAVFIATCSGLGISYVQDLMPAHPGRATTMFTNAFPIGNILAAPLFGLAQEFGYRLAYTMNLILTVLGLLLLLVAKPPAEIARPRAADKAEREAEPIGPEAAAEAG
ncbi:MFS transporter [Actinoplanes sp. SE50]|uniref:sugar efflux transporter n=1 Tax=unclassified Actinoplanes TaxID=2626549 RepID=UPI00023ED16B|nr:MULTISPECIES: sugar efflux transporter [unclassified Actinoplanes]AEV81106.1 Sugar efflux transporter B [Actinoplanes sp. SE50/110]ATO79507.1 MFS transporter [Actinoplanes sp. SE50]SLL96907.1 MFS transporter [Actinoplanes sp. SE50/110]